MTIQIKERSTGAICSAAQWANDLKENERGKEFTMPLVTRNTYGSEKRLREMRDIFPGLTLAFKLIMTHEIDTIYATPAGGIPRIYVGTDTIQTYLEGCKDYKEVEEKLQSIITQQEIIVKLHNSCVIED